MFIPMQKDAIFTVQMTSSDIDVLLAALHFSVDLLRPGEGYREEYKQLVQWLTGILADPDHFSSSPHLRTNHNL